MRHLLYIALLIVSVSSQGYSFQSKDSKDLSKYLDDSSDHIQTYVEDGIRHMGLSTSDWQVKKYDDISISTEPDVEIRVELVNTKNSDTVTMTMGEFIGNGYKHAMIYIDELHWKTQNLQEVQPNVLNSVEANLRTALLNSADATTAKDVSEIGSIRVENIKNIDEQDNSGAGLDFSMDAEVVNTKNGVTDSVEINWNEKDSKVESMGAEIIHGMTFYSDDSSTTIPDQEIVSEIFKNENLNNSTWVVSIMSSISEVEELSGNKRISGQIDIDDRNNDKLHEEITFTWKEGADGDTELSTTHQVIKGFLSSGW